MKKFYSKIINNSLFGNKNKRVKNNKAKNILRNKRGNILINTLLTLTLSAISITGITRTVAQTGTNQENLLDRDLLVSFTDEVMAEYIPLVYEEFENGLYRYQFYNDYGKSGDEFEVMLNSLMDNIDYSKFLNCNASYTGGVRENRNYQMVCVPNNSTERFVVDFMVNADGPKEKNREYFGNSGWHHVYTLQHEYYTSSTDSSDLIIETDVEPELVNVIILEGEEVMYVELGSTYIEPGFTAYDSNGDIEINAWVEGGVNTYSLSTQTLYYKAYSSYDNDFITPTTRQITIIDTTAPEIHTSLSSFTYRTSRNSWMSLSYVQNQITSSFWATDLSNDISEITFNGLDNININKKGDYTVVVSVEDGSGNEATLEIEVTIK